MNIGKLRHRITLQEFKEALDEYKRPIGEDWVDIATVWASVEPLKGREYIQAFNTNAENIIRVRIRYRNGVKPSMRIKYGERILNIQSAIDIDERHVEMHLMCLEEVT